MPYLLLALKKFVGESLELDEEGQTLVEYALLLLLITLVVIGVVVLLGEQTNYIFQQVIDEWLSL